MKIPDRKPSFVALPQQARQHGAGYFEFAVVVIIFAVLAGVLLRKLHFYQEESERIAAERVVTSLRAALASRAASLYLKGNEAEMGSLLKQNPITWLEHPPDNYAGEFSAPKPGAVPEGHWYFDRATATLSYVLNKREYFGDSEPKRLNFKVKFAQTPSNITHVHEGPGPGGVTLERIDQ